MDDNRENFYSFSDIAKGARSFSNYILKKWWLFLLFILIGIAFGIRSYYKQKPNYNAVTTFILEDKAAGNNGLSSLASQFGFNIASAGGGGMLSGDNILSILRSKKIVQQVLRSRVETNSGSTTLADLYLDFTGIKKKWLKIPWINEIDFSTIKGNTTPLQDSVLSVIHERLLKDNLLAERANKQSSIIKVQVNTENCLFSRLMSERLVQEAGKLYLDIRIGSIFGNVTQLQKRSDSLLILLNAKSYTAAANQPLDINPGIHTAAVPTEIANRDKSVLSVLYTEVTKNLEMSKLMLSQQTPVIQVLDTPESLLNDNKKGMLWFLLVYSFGTALIFVAGACFAFLIQKSKKGFS
jgi:hypothetical protein